MNLRLQKAQELDRPTAWGIPEWRKVVSASVYPEMLMRGRECIGAGGFWLTNPGMARAWATVSPDCDRWAILKATRHIKVALARAFLRCSLRRMETTVRIDFDPGHRWARALGFQFEGIMRRYGPDGTDHALYGRLSDG